MIVSSETGAPPRLQPPERQRVRSAAMRVKRLYPGVCGEVLARELLVWEDFGYRFGGTAEIARLVDHALQAPLPTN